MFFFAGLAGCVSLVVLLAEYLKPEEPRYWVIELRAGRVVAVEIDESTATQMQELGTSLIITSSNGSVTSLSNMTPPQDQEWN